MLAQPPPTVYPSKEVPVFSQAQGLDLPACNFPKTGEGATGRSSDPGYVADAGRRPHGRAPEERKAVPGDGPVSCHEDPGGVVGIQVGRAEQAR